MVKLLDELSDLERLSLIEISASRISSYERCAAAYFYTYILFEPRGWNKWAAVGSIVHSVLENTDFDQSLNYLEMLEKFEDFRTKHDPNDDVTDDLLDMGRGLLAEFVRERKDKEWHLIGKELPFAIVIGPALVVGYIDQVEELGNCIIVNDFKTGRQEVPHKDVPYNFQLGIYALAMKQMYPDHRIIAQLDYLRSGRIKSHEFTDADLEDMERRLIEAINKIIDTNTYHPTQNKGACFWCSHAETGACEIGAKRINK